MVTGCTGLNGGLEYEPLVFLSGCWVGQLDKSPTQASPGRLSEHAPLKVSNYLVIGGWRK